jgi:hypothetical protein
MTDQEVKLKVQQILSLMKPEWRWAAMDSNGDWIAGVSSPICIDEEYSVGEWCDRVKWGRIDDKMFDLPPFPGDWRDSLVERNHE